MTEPNESLDIELFIEEIKKYPEIWNVAAEEYHDKTKKRSAWVDICRVFCDGFDEKNVRDKNEICNKLIKKWKNIKDNNLKSTKKTQNLERQLTQADGIFMLVSYPSFNTPVPLQIHSLVYELKTSSPRIGMKKQKKWAPAHLHDTTKIQKSESVIWNLH